MLEALSPSQLRLKFGFDADGDQPCTASIANVARACLSAWRTPPRQRVTTYLIRQLATMGFDEDIARDAVRHVLDRLIAIGDFVAVRLDGKASIILAMPSTVEMAPGQFALLGDHGNDLASTATLTRQRADAGGRSVLAFSDWLGVPDYLKHNRRRGGADTEAALGDYWALLASAVRHEGLPITAEAVRAVDALGMTHSYFGRHADQMPSGRWSTGATDGIYCGARPGRNDRHWHPIILHVAGEQRLALDLYDWDEWNWALLARGISLGQPERYRWDGSTLAFEHPIPGQYMRALTLLGADGEKAWTWTLSPENFACFEHWTANLA